MKIRKEILALAGLCLVPLGLVVWNVTNEAPRVQKQTPAQVTRAENAAGQQTTARPPLEGNDPSLAARPKSSKIRPKEAVGGEEDLVQQLRQLQLSDPVASLTVAQLADDLYPEGPTAPERSWFEARALVELGRFDEARMVALRMVEDYPEAHFTKDLSRHLLSHPFGLTPREH